MVDKIGPLLAKVLDKMSGARDATAKALIAAHYGGEGTSLDSHGL